MEAIEGTNTEFKCQTDEEVTITVTAENTTFLVKRNNVEIKGNVFTEKAGSSVTFGFAFNGSGGKYKLLLTGSKGGSFNRSVRQPSDKLPETRTYTFHV